MLNANKVYLFVSSVLFVFWYHSPNFLDTPNTNITLKLRTFIYLLLQHVSVVPFRLSSGRNTKVFVNTWKRMLWSRPLLHSSITHFSIYVPVLSTGWWLSGTTETCLRVENK
jgi:hypothetical protein